MSGASAKTLPDRVRRIWGKGCTRWCTCKVQPYRIRAEHARYANLSDLCVGLKHHVVDALEGDGSQAVPIYDADSYLLGLNPLSLSLIAGRVVPRYALGKGTGFADANMPNVSLESSLCFAKEVSERTNQGN